MRVAKRMRADLSHLCEPKFKHSFQVHQIQFAVAVLTSYYVLHCPMYNDEIHTLTSTVKTIDCRLLDVIETVLIKALLFGNCSVDAHRAHANTRCFYKQLHFWD